MYYLKKKIQKNICEKQPAFFFSSNRLVNSIDVLYVPSPVTRIIIRKSASVLSSFLIVGHTLQAMFILVLCWQQRITSLPSATFRKFYSMR